MRRPRAPGWRRWAWMVGLTVPVTVLLGALGAPSPALFAGLAVATALALSGWAPARVPRPATIVAQAVLGVVIGLLARGPTLAAVAQSWLPVLLVSVGTLAISMVAGLLMGVARGVSPLTGMLSLTAGGASGLVAVSRELGADERLVAVVQYLRVGIVTAVMPLLAVLAFDAESSTSADAVAPISAAPAPWPLGIGLVAVCCAVGIPLARLARMPAPALLGPMIVALGVSLSGATLGVAPPDALVAVCFAVIGWQAGVRFTPASVRTVARVLPLATGLILLIVVVCAALGLALAWLTGASSLEGYLATTPGGLYAVLAVAASAGVDVTFVVAVQVVRVILMLLVAPSLARWVGHRYPGVDIG